MVRFTVVHWLAAPHLELTTPAELLVVWYGVASVWRTARMPTPAELLGTSGQNATNDQDAAVSQKPTTPSLQRHSPNATPQRRSRPESYAV